MKITNWVRFFVILVLLCVPGIGHAVDKTGGTWCEPNTGQCYTEPEYGDPFCVDVRTTTVGESVEIKIAAKGNYQLFCRETIGQAPSSPVTYNSVSTDPHVMSCAFQSAGVHRICIRSNGFGGIPKEYAGNKPVIQFSSKYTENMTGPVVVGEGMDCKVTGIASGSLGNVFPTVGVMQPMFNGTFRGCTGLTSVPGNNQLFGAGITSTVEPISNMFESTFANSGLTDLPANLFPPCDVVGEYMFLGTFEGAPLTGNISGNLWDNQSNQTVVGGCKSTFERTFAHTHITNNLPEDLFAFLRNDANPAESVPCANMFKGTFMGSWLTTIPENLFNNAWPAERVPPLHPHPSNDGITINGLFQETFAITPITSIPENLFAGIYGRPRQNMFDQTFNGCGQLTGWLSPRLFRGIYGAALGAGAFNATFAKSPNLQGFIQYEMFANINGAGTSTLWNDFTVTFDSDEGMMTTCPAGWMSLVIPWSGTQVAYCKRDKYPFWVVTTDAREWETDTLTFEISASGKFTIDWGDGTYDFVDKPTTAVQTLSHTYNTTGTPCVDGEQASARCKIQIAGNATGYATDTSPISFENRKWVAELGGSLGAVFGTLPGPVQPQFINTFAGCANLNASLPEYLFNNVPTTGTYAWPTLPAGIGETYMGINGNFREKMFQGTFNGAGSLGYELPKDLFGGLTLFLQGPIERYLFENTFKNTGLTAPLMDTLFASLQGAHHTDYAFHGTFEGCAQLRGAIPGRLFAFSGNNVNAGTGMFKSTFANCSSLDRWCENYVDKWAICPELFERVQNTEGSPIPSELFMSTFSGCTQLPGQLHQDLFHTIRGRPGVDMFNSTFEGCTGLIGNVPTGLFSGIQGPAASDMFRSTFEKCSGLNGWIDKDMFWGIDEVRTIQTHPLSGSVVTGFNDTFKWASGMSPECPAGYVSLHRPWNAHDNMAARRDECLELTCNGSDVTCNGECVAYCAPCAGDYGVWYGTSDNPVIQCRSCPTGYTAGNAFGGTFDHLIYVDSATDVPPSIQECRINCWGGAFLENAYDTECHNVGQGFWAPAHSVYYGSTSGNQRRQCAAITDNGVSYPTTTIGYGPGADEVADCGKILKTGTHDLYLRRSRRATARPGLALKYHGLTLYADTVPTASMSSVSIPLDDNNTRGNFGYLRFKRNGVESAIYNPDIDINRPGYHCLPDTASTVSAITCPE